MKVLVTGGGGYIGSRLVSLLLDSSYEVVVMDRLIFGESPIASFVGRTDFELIKGDVRSKRDIKRSLKGVEAVVHLAGVVGDTACERYEELAYETNTAASITLCKIAKSLNIPRIIFASTCSVYGVTENPEDLTENSPVNPISIYAQTKALAEKKTTNLFNSHNETALCILRLGTAYGLSPRMRFDLAVNFLTMQAITSRKITIIGGEQWRPLIHVFDIARAILKCLECPVELIRMKIFNVGGENYRIKELGDMLTKVVPDLKIRTLHEVKDKRSYRVSSKKFETKLQFKLEKTVPDGISEIREAIEKGIFREISNKIYYNHLMEYAS